MSSVPDALPHDAPSRPDWRIPLRYLAPHRRSVFALVVVIAGTIAVQLATPLAAARFLDLATGSGPTSALVSIAVLTLFLALAGQVLAVTETWVAERVAWSATNELREDLTAHVLGLDAAFHHAHPPGELIERIDGDVGTLARLCSRFAVYVVGNAVLMVGVLAVLLTVSWRIGGGLTVLVTVALVVILWLRIASTRLSVEDRQATADVYGFLGETLAGREDIRASGATRHVERRWAEHMRDWLRVRRRAGMRGYAMVATGDLMFGMGMALALAVGALLFRDGAITIGALYLVYRLTDMLREPLYAIRDEIQDLQQAGASLSRVGSLLRTRSRIQDGTAGRLPAGPLAIDLDHVDFGYAPDDPVLHDLSLHLPAGRVLGVVGRTGSGKTTVTRLVARTHDPDAGTVRIGGVDLRSVAVDAVRARVGVVTQDAHLFDATLRDNLTLFDDDVPDGRLVEVLGSIGLGAWFGALPDGLDTRLGSTGTGLSAGEIQVVACARVMLRDPDVVILDEPSSKLDPATERLIQRAIARLLAGRTGIVVAHRLWTIGFADDILVLEDGRVVEHGQRTGLAADPGSRFAALLRLASADADSEVLA